MKHLIPSHFNGIVTDIVPAADSRVKGPTPWCGIIIHHTGIGDRNPDLLDAGTWKSLFKNITSWLTAKDENIASAHFHIGRYGECTMLANPDGLMTFHAGESSFFHPNLRKFTTSWNSYAIGVELLGDGNLGPFSAEQYQTLAKLCAVLVRRYRMIDPRCITGHENLSSRKVDPGAHFDWMRFFAQLFAEIARLDAQAIKRA